MSSLEHFMVPHREKRRASRVPGRRSFDLALRKNQEFDDIDPAVGRFNRSCEEQRLRETIAHRQQLDDSHRQRVRGRRDAEREKFNTLAYSRYVAAVRRKEPHAVTRWKSSRTSSQHSDLSQTSFSGITSFSALESQIFA